MGRSPCCDKSGLKKGPWLPEEDEKLKSYIELHGASNWRTLPKNAGLERCGKSCRLRWANYLRPDIKRGRFSFEEEETIIQLHSILGNKWSAIAARLPGRTDNEIKNYWNTHIRKRLLKMGIDPVTHTPRFDLMEYLSLSSSAAAATMMAANYNNNNNTQQQLNLSNLLGLQALLNPSLLGLLTSLASSPSTSSSQFNQAAYNSHQQQQQGGEGGLMISDHQIPQFQPGQLLPSLVSQQQQYQGGALNTQIMGPSPTTDLSCQTSPQNSLAGRAEDDDRISVGQWDAIDQLIYKTDNQGFGRFDSSSMASTSTTPLTASSPNTDPVNGASSESTSFIDNLLTNNSQSNSPQEKLDGSCRAVQRGGSGLLSYDTPILGSWDLSEFL